MQLNPSPKRGLLLLEGYQRGGYPPAEVGTPKGGWTTPPLGGVKIEVQKKQPTALTPLYPPTASRRGEAQEIQGAQDVCSAQETACNSRIPVEMLG